MPSLEMDIYVVIYDVKTEIDNYSIDPKESKETPGRYEGIFTWNESSFYPYSGVTDPGLKIKYDHSAIDVIPSKYFKSGIGDNNSLKLASYKNSTIQGAVDLNMEQGSVFLFKNNIPIASNRSVGIGVDGGSILTLDDTPQTLSTIAVKRQINGQENFLADIVSETFRPEISNQWKQVTKFSGICVGGKELNTHYGPFEYKNIDTGLSEYLIYNLPTYSTEDEYGFKCNLSIPTLAINLNTLNNFLVDQLSGEIIKEDLTAPKGYIETTFSAVVGVSQTIDYSVAGLQIPDLNGVALEEFKVYVNGELDTAAISSVGGTVITITLSSAAALNDEIRLIYLSAERVLISNIFSRTDIFNTFVVDTPNAPGEFNIDFTTGTLKVFVDPAGGEVNFAGKVDFYINSPSYVIFNKNVNGTVAPTGGPTITYQTIPSFDYTLYTITTSEKLTSSGTVGDGVHNFELDHGGVTDFRLFTYETTPSTIEYTKEYLGEDEIPVGQYRIDKFSGVVSINIGTAGTYDVYAAYNYGPVGHLEAELNGKVLFKDVSLVEDLNSNNSGFIVLAQTTKSIAKIEFTILSFGSIEDITTNTYNVDPSTIFNIKACAKSETGAPVPGVRISFVADDPDFEVIFSSGNTDRNGCVFFSVRSPSLNSFMFDVPWYQFTSPVGSPIMFETGAYFNKNSSTINLKDALPTTPTPITAAGEYVIEIEDVINPGPVQFPVKVQYPIAGIDATRKIITIDGLTKFKSSGISDTLWMFTKVRVHSHTYNGTVIDTAAGAGPITITHPKFREYMQTATNGVFVYKTLANELMSQSEFESGISNPLLTGGSSIILEQDTVSPISITGHSNGTPFAVISTAPTVHGYSNGQAVFIANSSTTVTPVAYSITTLPSLPSLKLLTINGKIATINLGFENIQKGSVNFTYQTLSWIDNANGLMVHNGPTSTYNYGVIDYNTGVITITSSIDIPAGNVTNCNLIYYATYNGAHIISNVTATSFKIQTNYNAAITLGSATVVSAAAKFEMLDGGVNATFTDGELVWTITPSATNTGIPDVDLFKSDGNGLYPYQYRFLTTRLESTAHFEITDPFSGKIIQSEDFTITSDLPSQYYGVFVLDENILNTGSYIT